MADAKNEKDLELNKEASASSSEGEEDHEVLPAKEINERYTRELDINHGGFPWRDMEVLEGKTPVYWCENSEVTRHKPDITLHKGGKDGPVCGASHYRFKRSLTCGLGSDETSMRWAKWEKHGAFKWSFTLEWDGKHYTLRRASSEEHGGTGAQRLLLTHFKVTDDASGQIVGLYVSEVGFGHKKGTLKLAAGVNADLEILILLGVTSIRDKQFRRAKYLSGAGGGGGGGGGGG